MPRHVMSFSSSDIYTSDYVDPPVAPRPRVEVSYRPRDDMALVTSSRTRTQRTSRVVGSTTPPDLLFCVELGLLLRSQTLRHQRASTLKEEIASWLQQAGIPAHAHYRGDRSENYKHWTIAEDASIPSQPSDNRFGIKMVSPFFRFGPGQATEWITFLDVAMRVINRRFESTTNHSCSTTIHLVPARGHWKLSEAQSLASTALYFERCFDALVPCYRRRSVLAKSSRYNRYFARRTITECVDAIHTQTDSFAALAARMNWCGRDTATAAALGHDLDDTAFPHPTFRWNFTGLDAAASPAGHGTIQFRQPPGATSAADAVTWVMLAGCFARLSCAYFVNPAERPSMAHLGQWIRYEARRCGFARAYVDELRRLFDRADTLQFAPALVRDAEVLTTEEQLSLRWLEAAGWNGGEVKFQDWMRCHLKKRRF